MRTAARRVILHCILDLRGASYRNSCLLAWLILLGSCVCMRMEINVLKGFALWMRCRIWCGTQATDDPLAWLQTESDVNSADVVRYHCGHRQMIRSDP